MRIDKDLVAASATPLVLGILADGESYGYAILKQVNELSGGRMAWTDGMLYPLLHRLERLGQVKASWGTSAARCTPSPTRDAKPWLSAGNSGLSSPTPSTRCGARLPDGWRGHDLRGGIPDRPVAHVHPAPAGHHVR